MLIKKLPAFLILVASSFVIPSASRACEQTDDAEVKSKIMQRSQKILGMYNQTVKQQIGSPHKASDFNHRGFQTKLDGLYAVCLHKSNSIEDAYKKFFLSKDDVCSKELPRLSHMQAHCADPKKSYAADSWTKEKMEDYFPQSIILSGPRLLKYKDQEIPLYSFFVGALKWLEQDFEFLQEVSLDKTNLALLQKTLTSFEENVKPLTTKTIEVLKAERALGFPFSNEDGDFAEIEKAFEEKKAAYEILKNYYTKK